MYVNFFTSLMATVNSLSQNIHMGNFLLFLKKINLHWFRDFCRSFPKQQYCILFTPFVTTNKDQAKMHL